MIHLKICGLKHPENIREVLALKPDYAGFIFHKDSRRYVGNTLDMDAMYRVPAEIRTTGVFVNADPYRVITNIGLYNFDYVQLHGNETPEYCRLIRPYARIIKAFGVDADFDMNVCRNYEPYCDLFLFDTAGEQAGGNGKTFDHSLIEAYQGSLPFFLAGGIGLEEARALLNGFSHPQWMGLDVNSRFEDQDQYKNTAQLKQLIELLHHENNNTP